MAWVTARAEDNVLAFSTRRLLSDPSHARLSTTPVGVAPVGIQLFDHDRLIAVIGSPPGRPGASASSTIARRFMAAGASATVGTFASGDFPRQWGLSDNERFLYLTEFSSNILGIFPVSDLINDVRPFDPHLGFGSSFAPFGSPRGPHTWRH